MDFASQVKRLRAGLAPEFPAHADGLEYAQTLDAQDELGHLRDEFILPTKGSLKKTALDGVLPGADVHPTLLNGTHTSNGHRDGQENGADANSQPNNNSNTSSDDDSSPAIYFVGNSLGAQPKAVRKYLDAHLETWASLGVNGHFSDLEGSPLVAWQHMADDCAKKSADMVGASPGEIVIMNTLTANLHLMLASFYKPTAKRHKIIMEWKPFPSDYYAVESQIRWHGLDPATSLITIQPDADFRIATDKILSAIDEHADSAALLLLPGVQYYSGQLFDMVRITRRAHDRGLVAGWDLAHAAGNVELALHDWDVDFAVWCTYKYINAGPGSIAGAFVHDRHGKVDYPANGGGAPSFRPRLSGWYGGDVSVRFDMDNVFRPAPGASGFQLSNPSAADLASLSAALSVFGRTSMAALRSKSLVLTAYAEYLLKGILAGVGGGGGRGGGGEKGPPFRILTPENPLERGAQLSVLLRPGLLERVGAALKSGGVVCDQRKPDVIRVAPVPMYCTFSDVWMFMKIFRESLQVD
ncbi:pyridoxal phosphate-dependent transferase [Phialemonium atrogriseum]|uniref:Kynureninase n=1 Tax=Phialemonium atrogriseum TaxID=1093897 RepID=A0AAJ0BW17_9PEZI|nr:pyridoxal phosphate-dependent transferase [Phialemonium atrogriseum]KAK1764463.1 pyridoxal phosphate-dependent transferase [Phialemonium atrogriseum]